MENATRLRVWESVRLCERNYFYYDSARVNNGRWATLIRGGMLVALIGAGLAVASVGNWTIWQVGVGVGLALAGAIASVAGFIGDYSDKAVLSRVTAGQFSLLSTEWKRLLREGDAGIISKECVREQTAFLEKFQIAVAGYAEECGWTDNKRNEKKTEEAYENLRQEFNIAQ